MKKRILAMVMGMTVAASAMLMTGCGNSTESANTNADTKVESTTEGSTTGEVQVDATEATEDTASSEIDAETEKNICDYLHDGRDSVSSKLNVVTCDVGAEYGTIYKLNSDLGETASEEDLLHIKFMNGLTNKVNNDGVVYTSADKALNGTYINYIADVSAGLIMYNKDDMPVSVSHVAPCGVVEEKLDLTDAEKDELDKQLYTFENFFITNVVTTTVDGQDYYELTIDTDAFDKWYSENYSIGGTELDMDALMGTGEYVSVDKPVEVVGYDFKEEMRAAKIAYDELSELCDNYSYETGAKLDKVETVDCTINNNVWLTNKVLVPVSLEGDVIVAE